MIDLAPFTSGSRERTLAALIASGDAFVPRERLVEIAGVPPIRLVRLLAEIGEAGIPIETQPGSGHRLSARRAALDVRRVEGALAETSRSAAGSATAAPGTEGAFTGSHTPIGAWRLVHVLAVTSTNDVALALASAGESGAVAVVAETQTRGRGRESRVWHSPPCAGLWVSIVLRPRLAAGGAYLLTLAAAVAAVRAVRRTAGISLAIKWPNDLVVRSTARGVESASTADAGNGAARGPAAPAALPFGAKAGGILAEARSQGGALEFAIIGVGINVDLGRDEFPPELRDLAVSLRTLAGRAVSREALLAALLEETAAAVAALESGRAAALVDEFRALSSLTGRRVTIRAGDRALTGVVRGFDDDGALRLEQPGGATLRVLAGEATLHEGGR